MGKVLQSWKNCVYSDLLWNILQYERPIFLIPWKYQAKHSHNYVKIIYVLWYRLTKFWGFKLPCHIFLIPWTYRYWAKHSHNYLKIIYVLWYKLTKFCNFKLPCDIFLIPWTYRYWAKHFHNYLKIIYVLWYKLAKFWGFKLPCHVSIVQKNKKGNNKQNILTTTWR